MYTNTELPRYSWGFMFNKDKDKVLLILKTHPDWQKDRYSGIGGRVEEDESIDDCMIREFKEETGLVFDCWRRRGTLINIKRNNARIEVYTGLSNLITEAVSTTQEIVKVFSIKELDQIQTLDSVKWLMPMLLDDNVIDFQLNVLE